jgi:hypothetical protein
MPRLAPIAHHLDLYAYWDAKRGSRAVPARIDLNPVEIPYLLPFLLIVERAGDQFRNRLIGSAVAQELGQDPTGKLVGASLADPRSAAEARAIFERVFTMARPVFATGEFVFKSGTPHAMSLLALPLSDDGKEVNMTVASLVGRFYLYEPSRGWLKDIPATVCDIIEVESADDLERLCIEWERRTGPQPGY